MTDEFIPYGRQLVDEDDITAVTEVLRGAWLTTGPAVAQFEDSFAELVDAEHAVAVSNGTAALHLAMLAGGIGPGDEVIVTALTFAASANCALYVGADVVFADVREDTLTIDPDHVASLITERTRAIVAVDYAGIPCDLDELMDLCDRHDLILVEDACHAPGAEYRDRRIGSIAHMSTFSFHPVKHLTSGEGGMVTTNDASLAGRVRQLRNHGIDADFRRREEEGTWRYDMAELGFNYRLSDINCALGASQVPKVNRWVERRRELASRYASALAEIPQIRLPFEPEDRRSAWHLYPIRLVGNEPAAMRESVFKEMRADNIGVNVHYLPVYLHSYYQRLGFEKGLCPTAEAAYESLLSLPMWAGLEEADQDRVIDSLITSSQGA